MGLDTKDITIRHIGMQFNDHVIPCLCFCFKNKTDATDFYNVIHDYFLTPGSKSFKIVFTQKDSHTYNLEHIVITDKSASLTEVEGISNEIVDKLKTGLDTVQNYIILAGYGEGSDFEILDPGTYHMFKRNINIDGDEYIGKEDNINWNDVLETLKSK